MISGKAKIAGVIGWPVTHSLSPKLHNYWLSELGIDGAYVPMQVKPEELPDVLGALAKMGFAGANLTLPHKELVMPLLDSIDDAAKAAGMANTIVIGEGGKLHGMNTDSYGFWENIRQCLPPTRHKAVVLGAGGAARAVCHALIGAGFETIAIANRTPERAEQLVKHYEGKASAYPWQEKETILEGADLLVNATSLGMAGKEPLEIDLALLPPGALVTDIVYSPLNTPLLEQAAARGNPAVDGLGMLLHQAVPGFEAWFGVRPEVTPELRYFVLSPSPLKGEG